MVQSQTIYLETIIEASRANYYIRSMIKLWFENKLNLKKSFPL